MSYRKFSLSDELEQRFGEKLDEGPFTVDKDHIEALDSQFERMDIDEFVADEYDIGLDKNGQVYVDEQNLEAAYFEQFKELEEDYALDLRFDGELGMVRAQLRDYFVR